MPSASLSLADTAFQKLRQIVYERSGIWFADNKKYVLESRLAHRLEELKIDDFEQYVMLLTIGPYREDEFQEMFNRITINETSFFRNGPQMAYFEQRVLPQLLTSRKDTKRLRIWSAACSTGEEPYSLAIQIHRTLGVRLADWHVEILGTDISERVLLAAQRGVYGDYALKGADPLMRSRYFRQTNAGFEIDATIKSMVSFDTLNLKDHFAARRRGTWDVIFCRNVMIYFDEAMKQQTLKLFEQSLASDGWLFIGHSETLRGCPAFSPALDAQSFAYTKAMKETV
jgi:chemotaxis protein methyltransferase CheR